MTSIDKQLKQARKTNVSTEANAAAAQFIERATASGAFDVAYTEVELPLGGALIAATKRGLVKISYGNLFDRDHTLEELSARISPRVLEVPSYFDGVRRELDEYFAGKRTSFDLPIDWSLTGGFARRVLKRTARIPYGETSSYGAVRHAAPVLPATHSARIRFQSSFPATASCTRTAGSAATPAASTRRSCCSSSRACCHDFRAADSRTTRARSSAA
jgi:methylated-DNA-[protein]-cysteine S-methyltransferase